MTSQIPLKNGLVALVDDTDLARCSSKIWRGTNIKNGKVYVEARFEGKTILLHRFILNFPDGKVTHKNKNGLDCRKGNLIIRSDTEIGQSRRKIKVGTSRFKGVYFEEGVWRAAIRGPKGKLCLGSYDFEESAARQYDRAARIMFGRDAHTNEEMGLFDHDVFGISAPEKTRTVIEKSDQRSLIDVLTQEVA